MGGVNKLNTDLCSAMHACILCWDAGLPFLGVLVGMLSANIYTICDSKRYINWQNSYRNGVAPPEARLPPPLYAVRSHNPHRSLLVRVEKLPLYPLDGWYSSPGALRIRPCHCVHGDRGFPLFTGYMFRGLLPFVFYVYGERIRKRCRYAAVSAKEVVMLQEGNGNKVTVQEDGNERTLKTSV